MRREVIAVRSKIFLLFSAGAFAIALGGAGLGAGEGEGLTGKGKKPPSPLKALQEAAKNLSKAGNYKVAVDIEGGLSEREDHEITENTVSEKYEGQVYGPLMQIPQVNERLRPGVKAFRLRAPKQKGVAYVDGAWRNILSDRMTTKLDRLFTFPEIVLQRALANAPKTARWLKTDDGVKETAGDESVDDPSDGDESKAKDEAAKDSKKPKKDAKKDLAKAAPKPTPGKTVSVKSLAKSQDDEKEGKLPRIVRVDAVPEEALKHFTEVLNSGCLSAG